MEHKSYTPSAFKDNDTIFKLALRKSKRSLLLLEVL